MSYQEQLPIASRADLESRESDCKSVDDFVALAQQALADPIDKEYAKALLEKAEMQCQMPLDYIKTAYVVAAKLGDQAYAKDLYEQAEDMLFELSEFTAFARKFSKRQSSPYSNLQPWWPPLKRHYQSWATRRWQPAYWKPPKKVLPASVR